MAFEQRSLDDYVDVAQRIADFRERYPEGTLQPVLHEGANWRLVQAQGTEKNGDIVQQTFIVVVAAAFRTPDDPRPGIGMAWEVFPGRTPYTRGSELQNAETSAWGRAIIAVGASDSKRGIASREEVQNRQAERDDGLPQNRDGSLSRSRTSDDEKQAAGVMTSAQHAEHTQLAKPPTNIQPAERLSTTPVDDPWMDGPAGLSPQQDPEDRPGTSSTPQIREMHALFAQLKITDRAERLRVTRETLGLSMLGSSKQLSYRQAGDLLLALRAQAKAEASG
jgi:hypothetical protein